MSKLPEGWKEVQLDSVLEKFQNGYAFSSEGYVESGIPIISMANISLKGTFQYDYEKAKYWSREELDNLKQYQLKKGDLLIAMTDVTPDKKLIGRMAIVNIDDTFLLNQRVGLLKLKDCVNSKFLSEYGNFTIWRKYSKNIAALGAQANISTKDIKNGKISLPPLEEQKKIADILSTVDQKIAFVEDNISQTEELKKGLMQKLLTEGIGHTEFKDSEVGRIPESWNLVQFDMVCDIRDGTHYSPKYIEEGIPFITSKHLTDNGIDFTETNYITKEDHIEFSKRSKVDNGDILFGMIGTIGKPTIVDIDFEFSIKNVALLKLSNNKVLSNIYILNLLKSNIINKQFLKLSNGGVQSFIALGMIRKLKIPFPPLEEQKQIAEILSTVDQKLEVLKDKKESFEELKKGLMQKLLTGEVRV